MPRFKKTKKMSTIPLIIAVALIFFGLAGLAASLQGRLEIDPTVDDNGPALQVVDGTGNAVQQTQQTGNTLHQAARVQDLVGGKDGSSLQPGTAVDELLKNKQLITQ